MSDASRHLGEAGLRASVPRTVVLRVLQDSAPQPLCAQEVYRRALLGGAAVSMASVYRALRQLRAAGVLLGGREGRGKGVYGVPGPGA